MSAVDAATGLRLQRTSLRGTVYAELKRRILELELPPGAQLVPEELAMGLGVSRTPVREALALLARDHLVEAALNGTTWVARPSAAYLTALLDVRLLLDGKAAALAAGRIPPERLRSLRERCDDAFRRWKRSGDAELVAEVDEALHALVLECCGNEVLVQVLAPLADYSYWLRRLGLRQGERVTGNLDEHRVILSALAAGDPAAARAAMEAHIEAAKERQLASLAALQAPPPPAAPPAGAAGAAAGRSAREAGGAGTPPAPAGANGQNGPAGPRARTAPRRRRQASRLDRPDALALATS